MNHISGKFKELYLVRLIISTISRVVINYDTLILSDVLSHFNFVKEVNDIYQKCEQ